jgi:hypothetical protein
MQHEMDALAARITKEVSDSGFCKLEQGDMAFMWPAGSSISHEEKCMHIQNFAVRYHFAVAINFDTLSGVFLISK